MYLRKVPAAISILLAVLIFSVPAAEAGLAIRLEKEVPQSAVKGVNPITVSLFDSRNAASPVSTQNFGVGELMVSMLDTLNGAPMYRIRMDFTSTDALTSGMDLWWEFSLGGAVMGKRQRVPQSAWAIFAVEADTVDGQHASDFAPSVHEHAGLGSGDITSVGAGTGLTGGGDANDVTLSADTSYLQRRVSDSCSSGSSIRYIYADGNVLCETDNDSYVGQGETSTIWGGTGWAAASPSTIVTHGEGVGYFHNNDVGTHSYYHSLPIPSFFIGRSVSIRDIEIIYECTSGEYITDTSLRGRSFLLGTDLWRNDTTDYSGSGTITLTGGTHISGVPFIRLRIVSDDPAGYCRALWKADYRH